MKKHKTVAAIILIVLLTLTLFGCAKQNGAPAETTVVTEGPGDIIEYVETDAPKTSIELYFEQCAALAEEGEKPIRTSSDVWSEEAIDNSQVKYTSLGGSVVNTVVYDTEKERVLSVSSALDINSYADEELRASQIYNVSVFAAVMTNGDIHTVSDFCCGFESVIESGVEMYQNDAKLTLEADDTNITMTAQATAIYD